MRRRFIFSTATILCCGLTSFASAQLDLASTPTLAPQLYLAQSSSDDPGSIVDSTVKSSPFDIFADTPSIVGTPESTQQLPQIAESQSQEPTSTPVGRRHHLAPPASGPVPVQILASQPAQINYFPPIDYASQQRRAPNLVVNYMSREWCTDGLWDNYAAERNAQCAKQAELIAGRGHCGQCGMHGNCGQISCGQQSCQPVVNRYRNHCGHCGAFNHGKLFRQGNSCGQAGCDAPCTLGGQGCQSSAQSGSSCDCAQSSEGTSQQMVGQYAHTQAGPNGRPKPIDLPPPPQEAVSSGTTDSGKVALQPLSLSR